MLEVIKGIQSFEIFSLFINELRIIKICFNYQSTISLISLQIVPKLELIDFFRLANQKMQQQISQVVKQIIRLLPQKMSKPNGLKLAIPPNNPKPQTPPFQNQFLQNQQDVPYSHNYQMQMQNLKSNGSVAHSQYLPTDTKIKQQKKKIDHNNGDGDGQVKRIKSLNNGMERLSVSILEMKEKYKDLDMEQVLFKKRSEKKEYEIKQFLSQKKAQKIKLLKSRRKREARQAKSLQQSINLQNKQAKEKQMQLIKQSLDKLKEMKSKKQQQKQIQAQRNAQITIMYSKIKQQEKKQPKFHLRKMQEDNKLNSSRIKEEKQYLAKRRENYKPLDLEQIQNHGKKHDELLQQLDSVKKAQKEEEYLKILEHNKKLQEFYRGKTYDFVVQQEQQRKGKKSEPLEKYKKIKNYQDYVRENFIPKTQEKKQKELSGLQDKHSSMSHREVRRYRYLQGVSYGEIIQNRPLAKTEEQQRKMGNDYMAYMRSLPKRKGDQNSLNFSQGDISLQQKILEKKPNPLAERSGRKSVQIRVSDKPTRDQLGMLMKQLKNKDQELKLKEKVIKYTSGAGSPNANPKEIGDQLIFNIQRKLNLLSKL